MWPKVGMGLHPNQTTGIQKRALNFTGSARGTGVTTQSKIQRSVEHRLVSTLSRSNQVSEKYGQASPL